MSVVSVPTVLGTNTHQSTIVVPSARVGIAVVDSGTRATKFKYCDEITANENKNDNYISTNMTLKELVKKAKCWPNYDRELMERFFEIKHSNGEVVTTLGKSELSTFTVHEIITIMNIQNGEFHIVANTRYQKMESVDIRDDVSL